MIVGVRTAASGQFGRVGFVNELVTVASFDCTVEIDTEGCEGTGVFPQSRRGISRIEAGTVRPGRADGG